MNKKTDKADLEKSKGLFFATGFAVVLLLALIIIEHKVPVKNPEEESVFMGEPEFISRLVIIEQDIEAPAPKKLLNNNIKQTKNNEKVKQTLQNSSQNTDIKYEEFYGESAESRPSKKIAIAEQKARFPGGEEAFNNYIKTQLIYPEKAKANKVQGRVYVKFTVEKDGTISQEKIVNSSNNLLNQEALKLIRSMPKWEPAVIDGKSAASQRIFSVVFKL
jgi:protein TonB